MSASSQLQQRLEEFLLGANHDVTLERWAASFSAKHREHPFISKMFRVIEKEWERREQAVRQSIRTEASALRSRRRMRGQLTVEQAIATLEHHEHYLLQAQASLKATTDAHLAAIDAQSKSLGAVLDPILPKDAVTIEADAGKALVDALHRTVPSTR